MEILSTEMVSGDTSSILPKMKISILVPLSELVQAQKMTEQEQDTLVGSSLRKAYQEYLAKGL